MVPDMEVDKVTDKVAGHGCWLIGPKLCRPEAYPTCVSSIKLCEFILSLSRGVTPFYIQFLFNLFAKNNGQPAG